MRRYCSSGSAFIIFAILGLLLVPRVAVSIDDAGVNKVVTSLQIVKVAGTDHYAKFGSLLVDPAFDYTLLHEGLLEEPLSVMLSTGIGNTNSHVQIVKALASGAVVTATNAAYSFTGGHTNETAGSVVVEAVISNVASQDARKLSLQIDGPELSNALGEADLKGRVKFGAIPSNGFGEVHVYLMHWAGKR